MVSLSMCDTEKYFNAVFYVLIFKYGTILWTTLINILFQEKPAFSIDHLICTSNLYKISPTILEICIGKED